VNVRKLQTLPFWKIETLTKGTGTTV